MSVSGSPLPAGVSDPTAYETSVTAPGDLREFWDNQLRLAQSHASAVRVERVQEDLFETVEVHDVTFSGAHGTPVRAWLILPGGAEPVPVMIQYAGYGGGRGRPADHMMWPAAGLGVLVMDTRGQGGGWTVSETADVEPPGAAAPQVPGYMTRGVLSAETYYYTRLWTDAARLLQVAASGELHPRVDPQRIGVTGGSQGGAMALVAAALVPDGPRFVHSELPFMCEVRHAVELAEQSPYEEVVRYLHLYPHRYDAVMATMSYVDCTVLAPWITAPTLMAVGMKDTVCPPPTVFAAYNALQVEKQIEVFPFTPHETPPGWREQEVSVAKRVLNGGDLQ